MNGQFKHHPRLNGGPSSRCNGFDGLPNLFEELLHSDRRDSPKHFDLYPSNGHRPFDVEESKNFNQNSCLEGYVRSSDGDKKSVLARPSSPLQFYGIPQEHFLSVPEFFERNRTGGPIRNHLSTANKLTDPYRVPYSLRSCPRQRSSPRPPNSSTDDRVARCSSGVRQIRPLSNASVAIVKSESDDGDFRTMNDRQAAPNEDLPDQKSGEATTNKNEDPDEPETSNSTCSTVASTTQRLTKVDLVTAMQEGISKGLDKEYISDCGAGNNTTTSDTLAEHSDVVLSQNNGTDNDVKQQSLVSQEIDHEQTFGSEPSQCEVDESRKTENKLDYSFEEAASTSSSGLLTHPPKDSPGGHDGLENAELCSNDGSEVFEDCCQGDGNLNASEGVVEDNHTSDETVDSRETEEQGTRRVIETLDNSDITSDKDPTLYAVDDDVLMRSEQLETNCADTSPIKNCSNTSCTPEIAEVCTRVNPSSLCPGIQPNKAAEITDFPKTDFDVEVEKSGVDTDFLDESIRLESSEKALDPIQISNPGGDDGNINENDPVSIEDKVGGSQSIIQLKASQNKESSVSSSAACDDESKRMETCLTSKDSICPMGNEDLTLPVILDVRAAESDVRHNGDDDLAGEGCQSVTPVDAFDFFEPMTSVTRGHTAKKSCSMDSEDQDSLLTEPTDSNLNSDVAMDIDMSGCSRRSSAVDLQLLSPLSDDMMTDNGSEYSGSVASSDNFDESYVENLLKKAKFLSDHEHETANDKTDKTDSQLPSTRIVLESKELGSNPLAKNSDVRNEIGQQGHCGDQYVHKKKQHCEQGADGSVQDVVLRETFAAPDCCAGESACNEREDPESFHTSRNEGDREWHIVNNRDRAGCLKKNFSSTSSVTSFSRCPNAADGENDQDDQMSVENTAEQPPGLRMSRGQSDPAGNRKKRLLESPVAFSGKSTNSRDSVRRTVEQVASSSCGVADTNNNEHAESEKLLVTLTGDSDPEGSDSLSDSVSEHDFCLQLSMEDDTCSLASSSSTACHEQDDASSKSSTSVAGYSSNSTSTFHSVDHEDGYSGQNVTESCTESLRITLVNVVNPQTGEMNWIPSNISDQSTGNEENAAFRRRVKRCSKPRRAEQRFSLAKPKTKGRMGGVDQDNFQNPTSLIDLASKPLEDFIKNQEAVYRSATKNSKSAQLSIDMNDHVTRGVGSTVQGGGLHLGNIEVMYEMARRSFGESQIKRCRASPRSLFIAAKQGNTLQVLVLAAGCNVNSTIPQENHKTAMHAAAGAGHVPSLRILYMAGGNLSSLDSKLRTPLFDAVENHRIGVVKFLINSKVNLALKDMNGMTVLHIAAKKSLVDIINLLMETRKMNIDEQDSGGWTPLMWTAEAKHFDAAKCLLKWGADLHKQDKERNTCLHWAALSGSAEIMELLLEAKVNIDSTNQFGATALHISARERKLQNLQVLQKYHPNLEIKDAEGKTPLQLVPYKSRCYTQLRNMQNLASLRKNSTVERLVTSDVSRGQEFRPISCVNGVDDETLPMDFVYVHKSCEGANISFNRIAMTGCSCSDGCMNERKCECAQLSARKRFWYDEMGLISDEILHAKDRPLVYECNMKCKCWSTCSQRVVQSGIRASLQVYKTKEKGWAVRTQALIPRGAFVCEYVGEILTDAEADKRDDDCYLFDLDVEGQSELHCLDAKFFGNVSRFINHSCDPNVLPVRVFTDHQIKSCPRIAFFASRPINPYEEICSDYGKKFWRVKKSEFSCVCNSPKCKYKAPVLSKKKTSDHSGNDKREGPNNSCTRVIMTKAMVLNSI